MTGFDEEQNGCSCEENWELVETDWDGLNNKETEEKCLQEKDS